MSRAFLQNRNIAERIVPKRKFRAPKLPFGSKITPKRKFCAVDSGHIRYRRLKARRTSSLCRNRVLFLYEKYAQGTGPRVSDAFPVGWGQCFKHALNQVFVELGDFTSMQKTFEYAKRLEAPFRVRVCHLGTIGICANSEVYRVPFRVRVRHLEMRSSAIAA